jgi:hypothetical protein
VTPEAGYSGTPLARKLGVKAGHTILLFDAPPEWVVPEPPDGVEFGRRSSVPRTVELEADVVLAFFRNAAALRRSAPALATKLRRGAALWVAWPRRAGGHMSDVTDQLLREVLLPVGVVDTKVAALDHNWSGLRFVWRRS